MTTLFRVRVALTGFPGGPGVSTFYFLDVSTAIESLNQMYQTMVGAFPLDCTINVERTGDKIEDTTGVLVGSWVGGVTAPIVGTANGVYAAPVGFLMGWETPIIADGHRVRGKTFMVPAVGTVFDHDGSLLNVNVVAFAAAGNTMIAQQAASFVVWHRPRLARAATATQKALAAHPGSNALVTACRVPDKAVVLRSRRD